MTFTFALYLLGATCLGCMIGVLAISLVSVNREPKTKGKWGRR